MQRELKLEIQRINIIVNDDAKNPAPIASLKLY